MILDKLQPKLDLCFCSTYIYYIKQHNIFLSSLAWQFSRDVGSSGTWSCPLQ